MEQKIFPLLKPYDWPHIRLAVARKLIEGNAKSPWLAFAFDQEDSFRFVTNQDPVPGLAEMEVQALVNLSNLTAPTWQEFRLGTTPVLTASGTDYSSERILDPAFMKLAGDQLGCSRLLVAVPRRTVIYAADPHGGADYLKAFYELVAKTYGDSSYGNAPISPFLFDVAEGFVEGINGDHLRVLEAKASQPKPPTPPKPPVAPVTPPPQSAPNAAPSPPKQSVTTQGVPPPPPSGDLISEDQKLLKGRMYDLVNYCSARDHHELINHITTKLQQYVEYFKTRRDITGNFGFVIDGNRTPQTAELELGIENLLLKCRSSNGLRMITRRKERAIHIKVKYNAGPGGRDYLKDAHIYL